jgi:hypothetical protein
MLELRNVLNIKEFSGKLRSKKVWNTEFKPPQKVFETFCFWKQNVDLPPAPTCFLENFFREGPGVGGAQIFEFPTPNQIPLGTALLQPSELLTLNC